MVMTSTQWKFVLALDPELGDVAAKKRMQSEI